MADDLGIPDFLKISQEDRKKAWEDRQRKQHEIPKAQNDAKPILGSSVHAAVPRVSN